MSARSSARGRRTAANVAAAVALLLMGGAAGAAGAAEAAQTPPAPPASPGRDETVIGTIEGRPVRASEVLKSCDKALAVLALGSEPDEFDRRALGIVRGTLRGLVVDRLVLADAENSLTEAERTKVDQWVEEVRAKLIDRHGRGDPAVAEAALRDTLGWGLDETVQERRRAALTQQRLARVLEGKLDVGEDEIAQYYERNIDRYTALPVRTVRMIKTSDAAAADRIDHALVSGTPFVEVASSPDNEFKRSRGGLFASPIRGDHGLVAPLARAVEELGAGRRSERIRFQGGHAWIMVESVTPGEVVPLAEARSEIESALRSKRHARLTSDHVRALVERADMTPIDGMVANAMRAVKRRYEEIRHREASGRTASGDGDPVGVARPGR